MMYAYVWRNGRLGFGKSVPNGALPFCIHEGATTTTPVKQWKEKIQVQCRLAYDGKTYLIPGIPEAENEIEAYEALNRFSARIEWIFSSKEERGGLTYEQFVEARLNNKEATKH